MGPFAVASTSAFAARRTRGVELFSAASLCTLLGCLACACSAPTNGGSSDAGQFPREGGVDSARDDGSPSSPVLDGGCTLSAPNSEGACTVDEDCIGISGTMGGTLRCIDGRCPPFCTRTPIPPLPGAQTQG